MMRNAQLARNWAARQWAAELEAGELVKSLKKKGAELSGVADIDAPVRSGATPRQGSFRQGEPDERDENATRIDLELVSKAQQGDLGAFRDLVSKYQTRAHAVALGIVGNHHDAEDLIQEAFLKAFRNLKSFRGQSGFYTWLYRIVFNLAIDLGRRKYRKSEIQARDTQVFDGGQRHSSVDASSYMSRTTSPDEEYERAQLRKRLDSAIGQLSPDHRAVILMREVEGLSYEEISESLGCSKGTVMSRLHHARKKLQRALADISQPSTAGGPINQGGASSHDGGPNGGSNQGGPGPGKGPSFDNLQESLSATLKTDRQFFGERDVEEVDSLVEPDSGAPGKSAATGKSNGPVEKAGLDIPQVSIRTLQ